MPPPTKKASGPSYVWLSPLLAVSSTKWGGPRAIDGVDRPGAPITTQPAAASATAPSTPPMASVRRRDPVTRSAGPVGGRTRSSCVRPAEEPLGERRGGLAALRSDDPAREIVGLDVDPTEQARLAGLVGRVVV